MDKPFDYSEVPFNFGLCAAESCPNAATCLRQIAFKYVPEEVIFPSILNPRIIAKTKGRCKYYRPDTKIRLAKGFMRTVNALTPGGSLKTKEKSSKSLIIRHYQGFLFSCR